MSPRFAATFFLSVSFLPIPGILMAQDTRSRSEGTQKQKQVVQNLFNFLDKKEGSLEQVESSWETSLTPMLLECIRFFSPNDSRTVKLWELLEKTTGQEVGRDFHAMMRWLWKQDFKTHPYYAAFKAEIHAPIDERFHWWFYPGLKHTIRLDEIVWGGVKVDGIPPLEHPKLIEAREASYLSKKDVIFGVFLNGQARAYPKRILAWHELFNDTVGGVDVTCAYCTLCGSAVLYDQRIESRQFDFGTSGFLYRSNKLMYDRQTRSLWSSLEGIPVTGKLAGSGLKLNRLPIVTTTWQEWKKRHPQTQVLSLETGHNRDYGEGVAYRDYFATEELMFPVRFQDSRLPNKQEVLALLLEGQAVAYDSGFLAKRPFYHDQVGNRRVIILTDRSAANRVYDATGVTFSRWDRKSKLTDTEKRVWQVSEEALTGSSGEKRLRLPAHRAFWFGWHAQFPESRLVH